MNKLLKDMVYKGGVRNDQMNMIRFFNRVFGLIKSSRFKINPDKCVFGRKKLNSLEHTVSARGIQTNDDKSKIIRKH